MKNHTLGLVRGLDGGFSNGRGLPTILEASPPPTARISAASEVLKESGDFRNHNKQTGLPAGTYCVIGNESTRRPGFDKETVEYARQMARNTLYKLPDLVPTTVKN